MPRDLTQAARAFKRRVMMILDREVMPDLRGLVQLVRVGSVTGAAGSRPEATGDGDEPIKVLEPYGYASTPPGTATAVAFAPGTDGENRVAVGVSSTGGRPATSAGDVATWTAAGHVVLLDDDGGLTITAKDGQVIDLQAGGDIVITPKPGSKVRVGGGGVSQPAAKATTTRGEIAKIVTAISAVVPVGADTGALIVTAIQAAFPGPVAQLGSSAVEVVE